MLAALAVARHDRRSEVNHAIRRVRVALRVWDWVSWLLLLLISELKILIRVSGFERPIFLATCRESTEVGDAIFGTKSGAASGLGGSVSSGKTTRCLFSLLLRSSSLTKFLFHLVAPAELQ